MSSNKIMRKAVIFELDGVIFDTTYYHFLAWKNVAHREGIRINEQFNEKLKGADLMRSLEQILAKGDKQYTDTDKHVLVDKKNECYEQLINGITAKDLLPGTFSTLKSLRQIGVKTALASASKNAAGILERLGVSLLFDHIVDTNLITIDKPTPETFLTAAGELQVSPEECIGVEDTIVGIKAIKAASMYAIGVGDPAVLKEADLVITDLTSFPTGAAYKAIS
jgi:beta-phosphoglucomutase